MGKIRISSGYKPGKGDNGLTFHGEKASCLTQLYTAAERLQSELSGLILHSEINQPIETPSVVDLAKEVINQLGNLMAFYASSDPLYHKLSEEVENSIEELVEQWRIDAASPEFQFFYNHPSLYHINRCRVESRELERVFRRTLKLRSHWRLLLEIKLLRGAVAICPTFLNYDLLKADLQTRLVEDEVYLRELGRYGKFLNRLSTFFWNASQIERKKLDVKPVYWNARQ
jgi:cob(I)alamin adenosyltransferase